MAIGLTTLGLAACTVGEGVGVAKGELFELGCSKSGDYYCVPSDSVDGGSVDGGSAVVCATAKNPQPYDLQPSFFAGEPIDDLRDHTSGSEIMSNRLIIRLQRSGKQIEQNDVLTFDIVNSYEVARCVRGHVDKNTGANDWDTTNCFRASDTGPGRLRVQYDSVVHGDLSLKSTCTANLVATAISTSPFPPEYATTPPPTVLDGSWSSWVEFKDFGSAAQTDKAPRDRSGVDPKFHVVFGERIQASAFSLTLTDSNIVNAVVNDLPPPAAEIGGTLGGDATTGRFDFDLERGQGAQFFP
jgi:hypothetical protein